MSANLVLQTNRRALDEPPNSPERPRRDEIAQHQSPIPAPGANNIPLPEEPHPGRQVGKNRRRRIIIIIIIIPWLTQLCEKKHQAGDGEKPQRLPGDPGGPAFGAGMKRESEEVVVEEDEVADEARETDDPFEG